MGKLAEIDTGLHFLWGAKRVAGRSWNKQARLKREKVSDQKRMKNAWNTEREKWLNKIDRKRWKKDNKKEEET